MQRLFSSKYKESKKIYDQQRLAEKSQVDSSLKIARTFEELGRKNHHDPGFALSAFQLSEKHYKECLPLLHNKEDQVKVKLELLYLYDYILNVMIPHSFDENIETILEYLNKMKPLLDELPVDELLPAEHSHCSINKKFFNRDERHAFVRYVIHAKFQAHLGLLHTELGNEASADEAFQASWAYFDAATQITLNAACDINSIRVKQSETVLEEENIVDLLEDNLTLRLRGV